MRRSTDLRIAVEQVEQAEAQSRVALAGALTTITGTGTLTHDLITKDVTSPLTGQKTTLPDPTTQNKGTIALSQPVLALRAWYAIGTADRNEDIARFAVEDTKRKIALGVANAIVGVVTAERIAELNRVGLRNALTRLELANRKSTLGSGTGLDVVRARQDVETARATLVTGDESLRQAREALGLALGLPEQVGVPPNVDLNGLEGSARSACKPMKNLDERADIAALVEGVEVAHRGVNDVKLQFMPTINLTSTASSTLMDLGPNGGPNGYNTQWNIGAVLSVPIWEGGARYGNLRNAHAAEAIAGQKLEAARRQALIDVAQAERGVSVAEASRKVAVAARDLAAENDRLTRTAYQEGRGTSLELITAAQGLREAEIQLALKEFSLVNARVLAALTLANCAL
jgi:outer membrane protein TolC